MTENAGQRREFARDDVPGRIIQGYYHVYRSLGHGHLESVYRNALAITLRKREMRAVTEVALDAWFEGECVGRFRADLLVNDEIVVEIKAAEAIHGIHMAQLQNYLKISGKKLGFLFNFGPKPDFKRRENN
ncbi:MAG: uncharacterized protein JWO05_3872 [Gemmatimonadetes bacterium]|nr:uncharacterized protein [Gemmatimonadota bacterium]